MYGYYIQSGFMGRVGTRWMLFATEAEYLEYLHSREDPEE